VVVGDNRTTPPVDLDALVRAHGLDGRVDIRAYVGDEELAALYARATAFAFLSTYEGFGFTPLEALAAGVPIVVLETDVAREIYGPAAIYVARPDPGLIAAALRRTLDHDRGCQEALAAAPAVLARYSW